MDTVELRMGLKINLGELETALAPLGFRGWGDQLFIDK
jgi:hypothetical protein